MKIKLGQNCVGGSNSQRQVCIGGSARPAAADLLLQTCCCTHVLLMVPKRCKHVVYSVLHG